MLRYALPLTFLLYSLSAFGGVVVFEHLPESNSNHISQHVIEGLVLADDFDPARGGVISRAEWWGTLATSDQGEITLHFGQIGGGGNGEPRVFPTGAPAVSSTSSRLREPIRTVTAFTISQRIFLALS